jgi:hypothetical protein
MSNFARSHLAAHHPLAHAAYPLVHHYPQAAIVVTRLVKHYVLVWVAAATGQQLAAQVAKSAAQRLHGLTRVAAGL